MSCLGMFLVVSLLVSLPCCGRTNLDRALAGTGGRSAIGGGPATGGVPAGGSGVAAGGSSGTSGGVAGSASTRATGGATGTGGTISTSGASASGADMDSCSSDADCLSSCIWITAPTDSSQCTAQYCCGMTWLGRKRCDANRAAWASYCPNQSPTSFPCPCVAMCDHERFACIGGRCTAACPPTADASPDVAFITTDTSLDLAFVANGDGQAISVPDARLADSGAGDTGSKAALDAMCDPQSIWQAVSAGLPVTDGGCYLTPTDSAGHFIGINYIWGNIVLDSEGRVTDNTGYYLSAEQRQAWLDSVANDRWPCLADQTLVYSCFILKA